MAYDPADLKLPAWLLGLLDRVVRMHLPLTPRWRLGFTRPGIIFVAGLSGIWAAAFYSGNNLLYLCGAMLLSLMLAALLQGANLLRRLPMPVLPVLQAGETRVLHQTIPLPTLVVCSGVVAVTCAVGGELLHLSARCHGHELRWDARLRPDRRGLFVAREMLLSSAAPLGLFVLGCRRSVAIEVLVLPVPVAWLQADGSGDEAGGFSGDEWHDLRAYVAGDSPSRIHWRRAQGEPLSWAVKRFSAADERQVKARLRVDLRLPPGMPVSAFEQLIGQVWFWVKQHGGECDIPGSGQPAELIIGEDYFDLADAAQYQSALRTIAGATPAQQPPAESDGLLLSLVEAD